VTATIFDFNGVLVDDEHVHFEAFREVVAPLGIALDEKAYNDRYLGFDDVGAFRAMLQDARISFDDAKVAALVEAKKPVYMRRAAKDLRVFEGARALIERRQKLGRVGIVSGALRDEILHGLSVLGVASVDFIVAAEDTKACKPDPEGYAIAIARLGGPGVVIEDSVAGVEAAKAAGLRCVAVEHSYPAEKLRAAGADAVVARLRDLDDSILDGT
jgi:HAD superfamily hydrolase (TIGR01509 family)